MFESFEGFPANYWGVLVFVLAFVSVITNGIVMSKLDKDGKINSDEYKSATGSLVMSLMIAAISMFVCARTHSSESSY
jgi:hypothetical protein